MDMAVDVASPLDSFKNVASDIWDFTVFDNLNGVNSDINNSVNFLLPSVLDLLFRRFSFSDQNRTIAT